MADDIGEEEVNGEHPVPENKDEVAEEKEEITEEKVDETKEVNGDEEDEDESSSDEELVGLLDGPPQIMEGKRERTASARFSLGKDPNAIDEERRKKDEMLFTAGPGTKLIDIPYIAWRLEKEKVADLQQVHKVMFGNRATGKNGWYLKRHLREFSGFCFDKDDTRFTSRQNALEKTVVKDLKFMLSLFGLSGQGTHTELRARVTEFLVKPFDNGTKIPEKKKKSENPKKKKRKSSSAKSSEEQKPKKKTKKPSEEGSDGEDADSESEKEDEKPKKKTPKKATETKVVPKKKSKEEKTPNKSAAAKKSPAPTKKKKTPVKRKADVSEASDSEDDEPLVKKAKQPPTDDEIRRAVKEILRSANLEEITMKNVCTQVYEKFPDFDMMERKDFIKSTVKEIIS